MNLANLKRLLSKHGINQTDLARILRRDKSVVTNLFQGKRQLKAQEAALIASHIGVPVAEVMGLREKAQGGFSETSHLIPFEGQPSRAKRAVNIIKKDGQYYLDDSEVQWSPKRFALEMRDDSMNLSGIMAGDIIVSEIDRPCKAKQLVVAQYYKGRGATTIIRRYQPPFLLPHSTSDEFKALSTEDDDVRLVAPVLKLIRSF